MADSKQWYWAPHPSEGYVPVLLKLTADGGCIARMPNTGEQFPVEKDKLLPANETSFDPNDNLCNLEEFTEPALLHNLRVRFTQDLIYTWLSSILISVNPFKQLPIYSSHVMSTYRQGLASHKQLAPHIFIVADNAYKSLLRGVPQVVVYCSGESGAGKSEATKTTMNYLAEIASSNSDAGSSGAEHTFKIADRVLSTNPILEAFGNAKTSRNNNSSRFGKLINLHFNNKYEINGASIVSYLLEKSRIVQQGPSERNYHIFYQMLSGLSDAEKQKLHLTSPFDYAITMGELGTNGATDSKAAQQLLANYVVDGMDDKEEFYRTQNAFSQVGISSQEQNDIYAVTAGIMHLGNVEFQAKGDSCEIVPNTMQALKIAAQLLQIDTNSLQQALISQRKQMGRDWVTTQKNKAAAESGLLASVKAIYSQQFDYLIDKMNERLAPQSAKKATISILDIFGFEVFEVNSFEQLCINFTNEKMQNHFNRHVFKLELDEYKAEQLQLDVSDVCYVDNQPCLDLIEAGRQCILALCDNELRVPKGSDETLLDNMHNQLASNKYYLKPKMRCALFGINHYAGPVNYTITGFLAKNKDQLDLDLATTFATSKMQYLKTLMSPLADATKMAASATLGAKFKAQLNDLMTILNQSESHFVRCIKSNNKKVGDFYDGDMVLNQIRYLGLRDVVLIRQKGYPLRRAFTDFIMRYKVLLPALIPDQQLQPLLSNINQNSNKLITTLLQHYDPTNTDWKLGKSKVFYRMQIQTKLEKARDEALTQVVLQLQTHIRCHLERKRFLRRNQILVNLRLAAKSVDLKVLDNIIEECERMSINSNGQSETSQLYRQCLEVRNRLVEQNDANNALKKAIHTKDVEMLIVAIVTARNAFALQCNLKVMALNLRQIKVSDFKPNEIPASLCEQYGPAIVLVQELKEFETLTEEVVKTRDLSTAKDIVLMAKRLDLPTGVIQRWENYEFQLKEEKQIQNQISTSNSLQHYEQFKKLMSLAIQQQSVIMLTVLLQRAMKQGLNHDKLFMEGSKLNSSLPQEITATNLAKELKAALDSNDVDIIQQAVTIAMSKGFAAHDLTKQCQAKLTGLQQEQDIKKQLQSALISPKRLIVEKALADADALSKTNPSILQSEEYLQAKRVLAEMKEKQKKFNTRASIHARRSVAGSANAMAAFSKAKASNLGGLTEGDEDEDFDPEEIAKRFQDQNAGGAIDIWATASIDELQVALAEAESAGLDDQQVQQLKAKLNQLQTQRQAMDLLRDAVDGGNVRMLEAAIDRAEKAKISKQNDLFTKAIKMLGMLRDKRAARNVGGAGGANNRQSIFGTGGQSLLTLTDISQLRELNVDTFIQPLCDPEWYTSSEYAVQRFPYLRPVAEFLKSKNFTDADKIAMFKHQTKELPNTMIQLEGYNMRHLHYNLQMIGSGDNFYIPLKKTDNTMKHSMSLFKSIQAYMFDRKMSFPESLIAEIILTCQSYPYFRDEVFMMVMKQVTDNPSIPSLLQGWRLMAILSRYVAPSPTFFPYLMRFVFSHTPQAQNHHDYELRIHLNPKMTEEQQITLRNTARYCLSMIPLTFKESLIIAGDLARRNIDHYTYYLPPQGAAIVGTNGQPVSSDKSTSDGLGRYDQEKVSEMISVITSFSTKSMQPVLMHIYWPDDSAIAVIVSPWDTPQDIVNRCCKTIGIQDTAGLWIYEQYKSKCYALLPYENPIDLQRVWLDKSQKKRKLFKQTTQTKTSKFSRFTNFINQSLSSISEPNTVQGRQGLIVNKSGKRKIVIRRRTFFNPIQLSYDALMNAVLFFQTASDINNSLYHIHADSAAMLAKMCSLLLPKMKPMSAYVDLLPPPPEDDDEDCPPPPPPMDNEPQPPSGGNNNNTSKALLSSGDEIEIDYSLSLEPPAVDLVKKHKPKCPQNLLVGKYKITEKKFFQTMEATQLDLQHLSPEQYVATCMQLPSFCAQFFHLDQTFDPILPKQCILAVNQTGIFLLDPETMATIEQYSLLALLGWSSGPGRLTLHVKLPKPDKSGKTTRALRFETERNSQGIEVCSLLMAYAKDMLAKSKAAQAQ